MPFEISCCIEMFKSKLKNSQKIEKSTIWWLLPATSWTDLCQGGAKLIGALTKHDRGIHPQHQSRILI